MESYKKLIGKRIKAYRKAKGFKSQEALGIALGLDQPRIGKWESGQNLPDKDHRRSLADALGVPEDVLFSPESFEPPASPMGAEAELIAAIVTRLPALDQIELRAVLNQINDFTALK